MPTSQRSTHQSFRLTDVIGPTQPGIYRVAGLDFSGAKRPAAHLYWAEGEFTVTRARQRLMIRSCMSGAELDDRPTISTDCYPVLVDRMLSQGEAWVGCDFPFSIPREAIDPLTWKEYLLSLDKQFRGPTDWQHHCRKKLAGEKKRDADKAARAPWAPTNLRLYRQTYFGMSGILAPLVRENRAVALPFMLDRPGKLKLLEVCPACRLKEAGRYVPYKGRTPSHRRSRKRLVDELSAITMLDVQMTSNVRRRMIDQSGGDALDAVLATAIVARSIRFRHDLLHKVEQNRIEGFVYS
jgi:hypothetical protein